MPIGKSRRGKPRRSRKNEVDETKERQNLKDGQEITRDTGWKKEGSDTCRNPYPEIYI